MSIAIKKPMSITTKMKTNQKTHEHSIEKAQKVRKPMSIATKTKRTQHCRSRRRRRRRRRTSYHSGLGNIAASHAHTASPRPLARTHDTNTKRNRNRFPDWGSTASIISPQSPIIYQICVGVGALVAAHPATAKAGART